MQKGMAPSPTTYGPDQECFMYRASKILGAGFSFTIILVIPKQTVCQTKQLVLCQSFIKMNHTLLDNCFFSSVVFTEAQIMVQLVVTSV